MNDKNAQAALGGAEQQLQKTINEMAKLLLKNQSTLCEMNKDLAQAQRAAGGPPLIVQEDTDGVGPLEELVTSIVRREVKPVMDLLERLIQHLPASGHVQPASLLIQSQIYPEPVLDGLALKCDHFFNIHRLSEPPMFPGAFNFRQAKNLPVFGICQPSVGGIRDVSKFLVREKGTRKIVWVNLREEPVVYINQVPHSPREPLDLNTNIDYLLSIEGYELEMMEARLKLDTLQAGEENNRKLTVYKQGANMVNEAHEVDVSVSTVFTLREIYENIRREGIDITYARIPIQDESPPEEKDFTELTYLLLQHMSGLDTAFVFNCQMGRGRTTTGMVVATLLQWCMVNKDRRLCDDIPGRDQTVSRKLSRCASYSMNPIRLMQRYMRGDWTVVMELCDVLPNGVAVKAIVDKAIDKCSALQNLREAIYDCLQTSENPPPRPKGHKTRANEGEDDPNDVHSSVFWYNRGIHYQERYCYLILFGAYVDQQGPANFSQTFEGWMKDRWGVKRLLKKLRLS